MKTKIVGALACAAIALPTQAPAAELLFKATTAQGVLAFVLDETPIPSPGVVTDDYFGFWNQDATLDGAPITLEVIQFWLAGSRGGFDAHTADLQFFSAYGPQLFSGPTSSPVLLQGEFVTSGGDLSINPVGGSVPEPASWALMILGFGLAGATLRRRSPQARATLAA